MNPISFAPASAACIGDAPSSRWRAMFSTITMASSTTKPVAMVSAISLRLFSELAGEVHEAEGAHDGQRHRDARDPARPSGCAGRPSSRATTRPIAISSSTCTSRTDARMLFGAVAQHGHVDRPRQRGHQLRQQRCTRAATSTTLAPGWCCTLTSTAGTSPLHAPGSGPRRRRRWWPTSPSRSGADSLLRDDQRTVVGRAADLVVRIEHRHAHRAVEACPWHG